MKRIPFTLLLLLQLLGLNVHGENEPPFGKASIKGIEERGYYHLPITPELQKHCLLELEDLRVQGSEGREIPYLIDEPSAFDPFQEVRQLRIVKKKSLKKGGTIVFLEDSTEDRISALTLEVDQGTVSRSIRIEARTDKEADRELVHSPRRYHDERYPDGTRRFILRDLGISGHRFYRVHIGADGRGLDPRILEATVIQVNKGWDSYRSVPVSDVRITEKAKRTYVQPVFDAPSYRIDGIDLKLGDGEYFYRKGFLARGDPQKPDSLKKLTSFDIVSHGSAELHFKGFRSKQLLIVLQNEDLPSLSVEGIDAYQRNRMLLFRAEGKGAHQLRFGRKGTAPPAYELPHFRQQVPEDPMEARIGEIRWNGPPLEEWVKEEKEGKTDQVYRIFTTIGILLIWLFGIAVFVSIGILIYRRVL